MPDYCYKAEILAMSPKAETLVLRASIYVLLPQSHNILIPGTHCEALFFIGIYNQHTQCISDRNAMTRLPAPAPGVVSVLVMIYEDV